MNSREKTKNFKSFVFCPRLKLAGSVNVLPYHIWTVFLDSWGGGSKSPFQVWRALFSLLYGVIILPVHCSFLRREKVQKRSKEDRELAWDTRLRPETKLSREGRGKG